MKGPQFLGITLAHKKKKKNPSGFQVKFSLVQPLGSQQDGAAWSWTSRASWLLGLHSERSCVRWTSLKGWFPLWHVWRSACEEQRGDPGSPRQADDCFHSSASARFSWASVSVGIICWNGLIPNRNVTVWKVTIRMLAVGSWWRMCLCILSCWDKKI